MLQYLINLSAIWLLSLVVYEVFLKKETYHRYNRFYLLITFTAGLALPLIHLNTTEPIYTATHTAPIYHYIETKASIQTPDTPIVTKSANNINYLLLCYLAVCLIVLTLSLKEVYLLSQLFWRGIKHRVDGWWIIETGNAHGPFSLLNTLYVSNIKDYSETEWAMLTEHEYLHYKHLHFIDLVMMQVAKIIFWFHPLVYIYNLRLAIIHEFQADSTSRNNLKTYCQFLLEQSILSNGPTLAHSLTRSPLSTRFHMLASKSSKLAKMKSLILAPILLICLLCFTKSILAKDKVIKRHKVYFWGNEIEIADSAWRPVFINDSGKESGHYVMMPQKCEFPYPVKLNGEIIINWENYADSAILSTDEKTKVKYYHLEDVFFIQQDIVNRSLLKYLYDNLENDFATLPNGRYRLYVRNLIINKTGKVEYFDGVGVNDTKSEYQGLYNHELMNSPEGIAIAKRVTTLLKDAPDYGHFTNLYGKPVLGLINSLTTLASFTIKDHKLTIRNPKK